MDVMFCLPLNILEASFLNRNDSTWISTVLVQFQPISVFLLPDHGLIAYYTSSPPRGKGVYWIHPDICPSFRPSVDKVSATFCKKQQQQKKTICSMHFIPGIYPYGGISGPLFILMFLPSILALWWPNIWPKLMFLENLFGMFFCPIRLIFGI